MQDNIESTFEKALARHIKSDKIVRVDGVRISPKIAAYILSEHNHSNRPLSHSAARRVTVDLLDDRWKLNGDRIRFDCTGNLIDGQHRLAACIEAGIALETDVIFGLPPEVVDTIDIGKTRSAEEIAHFMGMEHAKIACPLAKLVLIYKKDGAAYLFGGQRIPSKAKQVEFAREVGADHFEKYFTTPIRCGSIVWCADAPTGS